MTHSNANRLALALAVVLSLTACGSRVSRAEIRADAGGEVTLSAASITKLAAAAAAAVRPGRSEAVEASDRAAFKPAAPTSASRPVRTRAAAIGAARRTDRAGSIGPRASAEAPSAACTGPGVPLPIGQIGNFSGIAGPITSSARLALAVWVASVNAHGGLACHPVELYTVDDDEDSSRAAAAVQELTTQKHVQALVGVFSPMSFNGVVSGVNRAKVPVIGGDLIGFHWNSEPYVFPQGVSYRDVVRGGLQQAVTSGATKVALLYCVEVDACTIDAKVIPQEMTAAGGRIVYSSAISITQTDFTAQCQNAKNAGAQALRVAADGATMGRVARSCAALNYHPELIGVGVALSPAQAADDAIRQDTLLVSNANAPWNRADTPGQIEFLGALRQYAPTLIPDAGALAAWASGKLFAAAVDRLGAAARTAPIITGEILAGLGRIKNETLGGLAPPLTFVPNQKAAPRLNCVYIELLTAEGWTTPRGSRPLCH
jgi:branched-chain amino acid transport system substrate-binding protein